MMDEDRAEGYYWVYTFGLEKLEWQVAFWMPPPNDGEGDEYEYGLWWLCGESDGHLDVETVGSILTAPKMT